MKVGTAGVLLGAWARGGRRVLDVGTCTSLIALMMAQRFPEATVDGVELNPQAARQAQDNVSASPFASRVSICECALQQFVPTASYDAIVTNPPFFLNGLTNPDSFRTMARHADSLTFADIFRFAKDWLSEEGELSAVIPYDVMELFSAEAGFKGFCMTRRVLLKTTPRKPVKRCLVAYAKQRGRAFESEEACLLRPDGTRSEWYEEMTGAFYL